MIPPVPFPRSYWVQPRTLLAGAYPGDRDEKTATANLRALIDSGIRHVVNLMEPTEAAHGVPFRPYADELRARGVTMSSHPIRDVGIPTRTQMKAILNDIDAAIDGGKPVLVHCWGGRGRTGTVIGCWLLRHKLADADGVLDELSRLRTETPDSRTPSPDTAEQRKFIRQWQEDLGHEKEPSDRPPSLADRLSGAVWGHLVGDALGVPYEFEPPTSIGSVIWGKHGTHRQPPGTWSDDGGLMLALLDSLSSVGFDPKDQGRRAIAWLDGPDYKPGERFDIGGTTSSALHSFKHGTEPDQCGGQSENDNGNGSLMRILPVALVGRTLSGELLFDQACRASRLTHAHPRSEVTCGVYCLIVRRLLDGATDRDAVLSDSFEAASAYAAGDRLSELERLRHFRSRTGSGYVFDTFCSAWDAFRSSVSYQPAVEGAIAYGNDTDTTAAVAGGLAGVYWGVTSIPPDWLRNMRGQNVVKPLLDRLTSSI